MLVYEIFPFQVTFAEKDQLQMMYSSVDGAEGGDTSPGGRPKTIYVILSFL